METKNIGTLEHENKKTREQESIRAWKQKTLEH